MAHPRNHGQRVSWFSQHSFRDTLVGMFAIVALLSSQMRTRCNWAHVTDLRRSGDTVENILLETEATRRTDSPKPNNRGTFETLFHEKWRQFCKQPKPNPVLARYTYWLVRWVYMLSNITAIHVFTCCWTGPDKWCWGGRQKNGLGGSTDGCCEDPEFGGEACPWAPPRGRMWGGSHPDAALARPSGWQSCWGG